ncbi:MAG: N-acetyl-gamma-glutamyl-phosphate reductase [Oscillospiraceae bacterium]|nr:N-acetyl-gamma-glutamyl-phosphate reductase [Oscillospiraceae bacterium]
MKKVFIDGSAGTTGLRIAERLAERADLELIRLSEEVRKDPAARRDALNGADIAFLCLPDDAAREAVSMIENPDTVVIDTSTAHRTADGWVYGFPELGGRREMVKTAKRIANPGCHASGFLALVAPLTERGVLAPDTRLSCFSLTGYSGGGKKMIAEYEADGRDALLSAPRLYGLTQKHKHLPEMAKVAGLTNDPVFCPVVAPFYAGMEVIVPLYDVAPETVKAVYADYYQTGLVHFTENADEGGFLSAAAFSGRDDMQVTVTGNGERTLLIARFDNLGKGASGAAIQNMNLCLGVSETLGLVV